MVRMPKTGPIFLFHIFKKQAKKDSVLAKAPRKNKINVFILTVCVSYKTMQENCQ